MADAAKGIIKHIGTLELTYSGHVCPWSSHSGQIGDGVEEHVKYTDDRNGDSQNRMVIWSVASYQQAQQRPPHDYRNEADWGKTTCTFHWHAPLLSSI